MLTASMVWLGLRLHTLKESDLETLFISDRFFARKFESLSLIQSVDQYVKAADKEKLSTN